METSPEESEDLAYFPDPATDFLSCPAMGESLRFTFSHIDFNFSPTALRHPESVLHKCQSLTTPAKISVHKIQYTEGH